MKNGELDQFVQDMAGQGSRDSEGVFTISWEKAAGKLKGYQAGDPDAFLLFLVSAGCAFGARNISIEESSKAVEVVMHGTYVSEQDIRRGFDSIAAGQIDSDALDLGMGLHLGLQGSIESVVLSASHPQRQSFRWTLTNTSEKSTPIAGSFKEPRVTVSFRKSRSGGAALYEWLFGRKETPANLGGYAGMSEACRLVDRRCDQSLIPITINSQLVPRPTQLPPAPVAAKVGELRGVRFRSKRLLEVEREWQGVLVSQSGPLCLVVNGLSYPRVDHPHLTGTVWCRLNRDLSRQRLVEDETYQGLMRELDLLAEEMAEEEARL